MAQKNEIKYAMLFMIGVLCALVTTGSSSGFGRCPKYPPLPSFTISNFTGEWYEVERSFYIMEIVTSCTSLKLKLNDKDQLEVTTTTLNRWSDRQTENYGIAIPTFKGSSIFRYKVDSSLPLPIARILPGAGLYNILFTDYTNFGILWSCSNLGLVHTDQVWILGRKRDFSATLRVQVYNVLSELNIDSERLLISKNNHCEKKDTI